MISRIEALSFRGLKFVSRGLKPFQVLVGPNASGKSTFLDVVALLSDYIRRPDHPSLLAFLSCLRGSEQEALLDEIGRRFLSCLRGSGTWFAISMRAHAISELPARQ